MSDSQIFVLDGGGSSCRAALYGMDGREIGRATGDFANLTSDFEASCHHVLEIIVATYNAAGLPPETSSRDKAVLGIAGAEFGDTARRMEPFLPFANATVMSDRQISIAGVLGDADGILAQIGTGSFFVSRTGGRLIEAGGWGLTLGDECSGAWLGREVLRASLRAHDGVDPGSHLTSQILASHDHDPKALVLYANCATPQNFANMAPDILAAAVAGDSIAGAIITRAVSDLEYILQAVSGGPDQPLYLCGGVGVHYAQMLAPAWRARLAEAQGDGLSGALRIAQAQL
jgi:glucosamine kinase